MGFRRGHIRATTAMEDAMLKATLNVLRIVARYIRAPGNNWRNSLAVKAAILICQHLQTVFQFSPV